MEHFFDPWVVGIDFGGSKVRVGKVTMQGHLSRMETQELIQPLTEDLAIKAIVAKVKLLQSHPDDRPMAIGIGMAGQIDSDHGIILFSPNHGWKNFKLRERLGRFFSCPICIEHDVRAILRGELAFGSIQNVQEAAAIWVGTGVGAAFFTNGKIVKGAAFCAGEVGHIPFKWHGRACGCGKAGCIEAYLGGRGLLSEIQLTLGKPLSLPEAAKMWRGGNKELDLIFGEAQQALLSLVLMIAHSLNPSLLLLGGGVMHCFPEWILSLKQQFPSLMLPEVARVLTLSMDHLGDKAGVLGASLLALQHTK